MNFLLRFKRWLFISSCCSHDNELTVIQRGTSTDSSDPAPIKKTNPLPITPLLK